MYVQVREERKHTQVALETEEGSLTYRTWWPLKAGKMKEIYFLLEGIEETRGLLSPWF